MRRVPAWIDARAVPLIVTMVLAVAGASYSFIWMVVAHHGWQSYSDLWNSTGLALGIGHGHFASVYSPSSYLDSPPGFEFLLAPVMVVGHALGLGTTAAQSSTKVFGVLLAAVATAYGCTVLFALDAVARRWEFSDARRVALAVVAGLGVVSAAVFWGHPEDCIALALVVWAALAVDRRGAGGLRRAGWLLGLAVACQPLALLAVAPIVACAAVARRVVGRLAPRRAQRAASCSPSSWRRRPTRSTPWSTNPSTHRRSQPRRSATWRAPSARGCTAAGPCGWWSPWQPSWWAGWPVGAATTSPSCFS